MRKLVFVAAAIAAAFPSTAQACDTIDNTYSTVLFQSAPAKSLPEGLTQIKIKTQKPDGWEEKYKNGDAFAKVVEGKHKGKNINIIYFKPFLTSCGGHLLPMPDGEVYITGQFSKTKDGKAYKKDGKIVFHAISKRKNFSKIDAFTTSDDGS